MYTKFRHPQGRKSSIDLFYVIVFSPEDESILHGFPGVGVFVIVQLLVFIETQEGGQLSVQRLDQVLLVLILPVEVCFLLFRVLAFDAVTVKLPQAGQYQLS